MDKSSQGDVNGHEQKGKKSFFGFRVCMNSRNAKCWSGTDTSHSLILELKTTENESSSSSASDIVYDRRRAFVEATKSKPAREALRGTIPSGRVPFMQS
jgi:hypothetical protein